MKEIKTESTELTDTQKLSKLFNIVMTPGYRKYCDSQMSNFIKNFLNEQEKTERIKNVLVCK